MRYARLLPFLISIGLIACGGSDGGPGSYTAPAPAIVEPTLASIQNKIFGARCTGSDCHSGLVPKEGLNLELSGSSFASLVGVSSTQVPGLLRVNPNNPDISYLIHKLEGTAAVGDRMPRNGPPYLTTDQINAIRQWISDGALEVATANNPDNVSIAAVVPANNAKLNRAPVYISIAVSQELDASLVSNHIITIQAAGSDRSFAEGNETEILPASVTLSAKNPRLIVVDLNGQSLPPDDYRILLKTDGNIPLMSIAAIIVDGDADGKPGGDLETKFTVLEK